MEQTLGKRIMQHRKRMGLTQDQLAEKLGVTPQAVSKWENDQSCPDITMIPQLADIFGISTDDLLGRTTGTRVFEGEIVDDPISAASNGKGKFEFFWQNGRKNAVGFAVFILAVGLLYLITAFMERSLSLWSITWPTALLVFGIFGLFPHISYFRVGCGIIGCYYLLENLIPQFIGGNSKIIISLLILLLGVSLLLEALKKSRKPAFGVTYTGANEEKVKEKNHYRVNGSDFSYEFSFGSNQQQVDMDQLCHGRISSSFGESTVSLKGVKSLAPGATLEVQNCFGELIIQVPSRYKVISDHSTAFASFQVKGEADPDSTEEIVVKSTVSFGETTIEYI